MARLFEVRSEEGPACVEHCGVETSLVSWCRLVVRSRRRSSVMGANLKETGSAIASAPTGLRGVPARCVAHASADVNLTELQQALASLSAQCVHLDAWGLRVGGSAKNSPFATESEASVLSEVSVMGLRERVPIAAVPVWGESVTITPSTCAKTESEMHGSFDPWRTGLVFDRGTMARFLEESIDNGACTVHVACARACACQRHQYADVAVLRAHGGSGCWVRAETWLALRDGE